MDPKHGGAYIERDPRKPWHRRLVVLNTNRKVSTRQWLGEDQILALRNECDRALAEIEASHAEATALADEILNR